jgi:hypothetical protein
MSKTTPPPPPVYDDSSPDVVFRKRIFEALIKQVGLPKAPDASIRLDDERKTLELDRLKLENTRLQNKLTEAEDLHHIRKRYTGRLFWLIVGWLFAVLFFVVCSGFRVFGFSLSDAVIISFITSTTVSVLGLFLVPAKWLYPSDKRENDSTK